MSEGWAAIVYGRTYHLDFRFITIPHDFTPEDLTWASQHIVATTQQARNLAGSPRWSLFKNNRFCVVGVTTAVKDLLSDRVKDDRGRPLYIFVGYVAQLSSPQQIENLPVYSSNLDNFKTLYREIEPVWLIRNYDPQSRHPKASQYYPLTFNNPDYSPRHHVPVLNRNSKYADKIYLWPNLDHQNQLLWQTASQCPDPTSICLNIKGKPLVNSPFLNLSCDRTERFQILDRILTQHKPEFPESDLNSVLVSSSLSQKISERAKKDLDLTLQQAAKMALASQELISNLADSSQHPEADLQQTDDLDEPEFGFKKKPSNHKGDWF